MAPLDTDLKLAEGHWYADNYTRFRPCPGVGVAPCPSRIRQRFHASRYQPWGHPVDVPMCLPHIQPQSLRFAAHDVVYTDGAYSPPADSPRPARSAAAVWGAREPPPPAGGVSLATPPTLHPGVNHAELSAIYYAVAHTDAPVIATDSLSSIWQIHNQLLYATHMRFHPHASILRDIVRALAARESRHIHTTIIKVPAHVGVLGNECADWLASTHTHTEWPDALSPSVPAGPDYWVGTTDGPPLPNLQAALKSGLDSSHRLGVCNTDSIYYNAYQQVQSLSHPSSHHFISSPKVSFQARRLALNYRGGLIYNAKLAFRYNRAMSPACPLCGAPDSQTHMLGGCQHPAMHNLYIARHHHAARTIALAAIRGNSPGRMVQCDVGSCTALSAALGHLPASVPIQYARRPHTLPRPDFTTVQYNPLGRHLIAYYDVKFGPDTTLESKLPDARSHYRPLINATSKRFSPSVHILLLGVGGRIPSTLFQTFLSMGISHAQSIRLCNSLNRLAVTWLRTIVSTRRRLEPD
jgi:ribonuclease HI